MKNSKRTQFISGHNKRHGVVFTCLTTRATHLEFAGDFSTDSFILALKRFIVRREQPNVINSDNGLNFRGAEKELGDLFLKSDFYNVSKTLTNYMENYANLEFKLMDERCLGINCQINKKDTENSNT